MAEKPTYTELKQKIKVLEQEAIKRKQTEEMLLQSEEKHRRIFENLQDVYYEADMGGTILEISPSIEKLSQYKREELIGKSLYDIYTNPKERDEFVKLILDKGKVNDYEIHLEDKDGSLRFCSITTLLIRDSQGTPEKIIGSMRNIAENKLAEELLRESEERFRNVYDIAPLAFVLWDRNTRVTDWNKKAEEIFGWSKEEVVSHNFFDFLIPEKNRPRVEDVVNSLLKGDILSHSINENLTKEGKIITCEWNNSAFHDDNGNIMGAISLGLDITEQKLAEEALRESEGQLLSVFRVAPTGIGVAVDRVLKQVNERICEMTGHSEIELIGQNARILYQSDEDYEYVGREKYKQITAHGTGTVETRWKHKDGRIIDVLLSSTPMDLDDLSKGVTFTALDITERKRTREALRIAHERFLTVLESIDATIYVADMETHEILFMNKNMIESFGRDMTGEMCWEVFRGESEPCQDCTNDQLIDKNRKPTGVCVWQGKNPITGKWYINHDRAIEWTDGRLVRLEIATDITNFKRMEQQLQQTDKFEAIGTLAGGLAHDFNNLLMGIQGRASLMSVDLEPSHSHSEHINAIEDYIRSATDLTRQLLGFARGGKYEVKPTDINNLVHNCAKMFNRTRKETRLHAKFQDPPPVVAVDQRQIEQVLLNLFINAWQAMPGGGELYLETQIVALDDAYCKPYKVKPGRYAKVSVTDTGIGMNASVSQRIFDPFFTTKEKGRGTGLGLASAYGIIKNHDGIITVYSEVGHGTTFNIYLPLSDKEAYREAPLESRLIKGSETVLIVDDEEMILEVGQAMLETLGYRIVVADGGEQAVDVVKRKGNEIDLVILDLIMPGMNGSEVFDRIREIRPQMSVVLSSGYAINGQADEIMKRGCNGFLQKPFNISELSQKVRQILDEAKSSA
jgi:two-component system cell cycle sensor histidine kinase/response regulator CckA